MQFYERYRQLCEEKGLKPQNPEMFKVTQVTSGAISGWKKGALPKGDVLCRLANYFDVTTDYLLGLSEVRKPGLELTEEELLLINAYRNTSVQGRFNIIQVCMNAQQEKGQAAIAG